MSNLYINSLEFEYADKVHELLKYLKINQDYLVNYNVRKDKKLPYTSSIIESAVENIINDRHKKKQKAQWTRYGAHNVLHIRTSTASGMWKKEWDEAKYQLYNYPVAA